ncbi:hypothetical protein GCM10009799_00080 [Nocardiopsis rhodophaea]|uniref:BCCT family transporter n=1 Tax=Nocardiopsis rhodophaea TaxID=280238 RepID=A0ABN2S1S1_9ACTN
MSGTTGAAHNSRGIFWGSAALVLLFVLMGALFTERTTAVANAVQAAIVGNFGWFYILVVGVFPLFAVYLLVSRHGRVRLGPDGSRPDYSTLAWLSMLYSAGLGIGLVFYGVAEPIGIYADPPLGQAETRQAAQDAMNLAIFHWALHPWALYIVVGLSIAYFGYRKGLPLTVSSALYPLLGERVRGAPGKVIDVLAVFGTLFGLATSLGLGAAQINAGLDFVARVPSSITNQIVIIAVITSASTTSVVLGIHRGIRRLSLITVGLTLLLFLFVVVMGPTITFLNATVQNAGYYLQNIVGTTFYAEAYATGESWQAGSTLFYWGWWVSWSPFAGLFIARISRGRTVREFIAGTLLVPAGVTVVWFSGFGAAALDLQRGGAADIAAAVNEDSATSLFVLLEHLPFTTALSVLALAVIALFFVTSSDSASYVVDIITSGGRDDAPIWRRIFWAVSEGVVAAILLLVGGLAALQTASLSTGLPFAVVLILMAYCLVRALRTEGASPPARLVAVPAAHMDGRRAPVPD